MDKIYFYILLLGYVTCFDLPPDWINPSDLHHSRKVGDLAENTVSAKPESISHDQQVLAIEPKTMTKNASSCICPSHQQSPCDSYMKRIINLLLLKTTMKNYRLPEDNNRIVPMALYFTSKNLEILHAYASDNHETFTWSDFDQAFSSLFEIPEIIEKTDEPIVPQQDYAVFIFICIVGSMLIVGLWLLLKSGSFYKTVCGIAVIHFCFALFWNLIGAYKKEKEKIVQLYGSKLISDQNKSSWWDFLNPNKNDKDDILLLPDYDPMFKIDYGKIVVETLSSVFYILPILGQQAGDMVANFYKSQNLIVRLFIQPFQWITNPILLIMFLLLLAIVIKGFTIKLPLFTLGINKKEEVQHRLDASQQQQSNRLQPTVGSHIEASNPVATIQEDIYVAGPSRGIAPLKRAQTEYISTESPVRNINLPLPAVTCKRKGPWQGSIVRYGFIKKRIVPSRYKEEYGN